MCFSQPKQQSPSPAPTAPPIPARDPATRQASVVPTPSTSRPTDVSPGVSSVSSQTADQRRRRISNMRFGLRSTIRTSSQGVPGSGKGVLVPAAGGLKDKLGE